MALNRSKATSLVDSKICVVVVKGINEWNSVETFQRMYSSDKSGSGNCFPISSKSTTTSAQHQSNHFRKGIHTRSEEPEGIYNQSEDHEGTFGILWSSNFRKKLQSVRACFALSPDGRSNISIDESFQSPTRGFKFRKTPSNREFRRGRSPRRRDQTCLPTNAEGIRGSYHEEVIDSTDLESSLSSDAFTFHSEERNHMVFEESFKPKTRDRKLRKTLGNSFQNMTRRLRRLGCMRGDQEMFVIDPVDTFEMHEELNRSRGSAYGQETYIS